MNPIKVSFVEAPIESGDVSVDIIDFQTPSSRISIDGKFVETSASFINAENKIVGSIGLNAGIKIGRISLDNLARDDWSFGYAQALKARECVVEYAGTRSNGGSVIISAFDARDNEPVFTDCDQNDSLDARPWTRHPPLRFKYLGTQNLVESQTLDAPGIKVPAFIGNTASKADNFLRRISDKREICCALAVEDRRFFSAPQILGHSLWTIDLSFTYRWGKDKVLLPQFTGSITLGAFKTELPADDRYKKIFDRSFFFGDPYNVRATELLNRHIRAQKSDRKDERDTRLPSVPADFFA